MSSSDSTDGTSEVEPRLDRTTGFQPTVGGATGDEDGDGFDAADTTDEVRRLRTKVTELEAELEHTAAALETRETRIEELTDELESARLERDGAREWAEFLDGELREHREEIETLEERVEALESGRAGLFDRLRRLFG